MKGKVESRAVPFHPLAQEVIKQYVNSLSVVVSDAPLFQTQRGRLNRKTFHQVLKDALHTLDIRETNGRIATHSMRKTFALAVHKALGENIMKTQKAMGHKNLNNTVKYLSIDEEEINNVIKNL